MRKKQQTEKNRYNCLCILAVYGNYNEKKMESLICHSD